MAFTGSSAPPALPTRPSPRYESLDAWRGITCLAVILYHSTIFGAMAQHREALLSLGGVLLFVFSKFFYGVMLFFVISGYCIAAAVDASARRRTPVTDYFWRRFRRIFPPFWIFLTFAALLSAIGHSLGGARFFKEVAVSGVGEMLRPGSLSARQWLGNLTLTEYWLPGLLGHNPRYLEGTGHAWSLAYEEQFYAVCGLLLILSQRRMNRFFAGAVCVTLLTLGLESSPALRLRVSGLFLDGHWLVFACGIAVYYDRMYAGPLGRWAIRGAIGALLVLASISPQKSWDFIVGAVFALALIALQRWDRAWASSRAPRFLWWCGTRCYSLYLVHWTIVRPLTRILFDAGVISVAGTLLVTLPICLGVSAVIASIFHDRIEQPFMNHPDKVPAASPSTVPGLLMPGAAVTAAMNPPR